LLSALFGSLSVFLATRGAWLVAGICGALTLGFLVMLYRAAFGAPRSLNHKETRVVAWAFVALGLCGFAMALMINGSMTHRLMVLGASLTFFSAGIAGARSRGHDA
jgi:hypothetical protein